jgi:hypothetical protein
MAGIHSIRQALFHPHPNLRDSKDPHASTSPRTLVARERERPIGITATNEADKTKPAPMKSTSAKKSKR